MTFRSVLSCPLAPARALTPRPQSEGFEADNTVSPKRAWLFVSYLGCLAALGGALASLITFFDVDLPERGRWVGAALVIQVSCILASGMVRALLRRAAAPLHYAFSARPLTPSRVPSSTGSPDNPSHSTRLYAYARIHDTPPAHACVVLFRAQRA